MANVLQVNSLSLDQAKAFLDKLLTRFSAGHDEPLIFGRDSHRPEAVIITLTDYKRLLRYDSAIEASAQASISRRHADTPADSPVTDLDQLASELGLLGDDGAAQS